MTYSIIFKERSPSGGDWVDSAEIGGTGKFKRSTSGRYILRFKRLLPQRRWRSSDEFGLNSIVEAFLHESVLYEQYIIPVEDADTLSVDVLAPSES